MKMAMSGDVMVSYDIKWPLRDLHPSIDPNGMSGRKKIRQGDFDFSTERLRAFLRVDANSRPWLAFFNGLVCDTHKLSIQSCLRSD